MCIFNMPQYIRLQTGEREVENQKGSILPEGGMKVEEDQRCPSCNMYQ